MARAVAELIDAVVQGRLSAVAQLLGRNPGLTMEQARAVASRQHAGERFFAEIAHNMYAGDTALHLAAAAFRRPVAELLVQHGASCRVRNRRDAEPLDYAADANRWEPEAQRATIEYLLSMGADPNALDRSGVSPLHRAVRTRSSDAVRALPAAGADARSKNANGSTPLHLAVRDTGRSGAGSVSARTEQAKIIAVLLEARRARDRY